MCEVYGGPVQVIWVGHLRAVGSKLVILRMARLQSTLLIHSKQIVRLPLAKRTEGLKLLVTIRRCNVEFDTDAIQTIVHCSLSGLQKGKKELD